MKYYLKVPQKKQKPAGGEVLGVTSYCELALTSLNEEKKRLVYLAKIV